MFNFLLVQGVSEGKSIMSIRVHGVSECKSIRVYE